MKLTTTIEWHNLLENPDDLPEDGTECILAVFIKDEKKVNFSHYDSVTFRKDHGDFYINGFYDTWSSNDPKYNLFYRVIAWAKYPYFDSIKATLLKECLEKEAAKND